MTRNKYHYNSELEYKISFLECDLESPNIFV